MAVSQKCVVMERQLKPVDDVSECIFAIGRVNRRTGVAGNEVGGIVKQVDVD